MGFTTCMFGILERQNKKYPFPKNLTNFSRNFFSKKNVHNWLLETKQFSKIIDMNLFQLTQFKF